MGVKGGRTQREMIVERVSKPQINLRRISIGTQGGGEVNGFVVSMGTS